MSDDEAEYSMLMPFVVVTSTGGPYDDNAYSAGWEMGALDKTLAANLDSLTELMISTGNVPQADLLAMKYGFTFEHHLVEDHPEWTHAIFTPSPEVTL